VIALALVAAAASATSPNLLLVTIDTLRADRLHAYGYASIETPSTDRLARSGLLVQDATVQVPQTRPSHASILTGLLPYQHGIRDNYSPALSARHATLATVLRGRGYATGAFIGSVVLAAASGLDRGFETYDDPFSRAHRVAREEERPAGAVVDAALAWLKARAGRPFFAWVHLYDPHYPYAPPEPFARRYAERPYDGEVAYADAQVGRLLDLLETSGLAARTLVVVTSDHGEGLGDHGEDEHMLFVYDSTLHVPLLLSWPGVLPAGTKIAGQFRSIDLLPTVLELMGVPTPAVSGASRALALKAGARLPPSESYAESLFGSIHFGHAPLFALRAEGLKFIDAPRPELYDLREDPGETRNLAETRGTVAERMRARLRAYGGAPASAPPLASADAGTLERMAALGYVGVTASRSGAPSGADPKDKVQEVQAFTRDSRRAARLYEQGDLDGAIALLGRLSKADILSLEVQYLLGRSLARKHRYREAAEALEEAVSLVPSWAPAWLDLARTYAQAGDPERAKQSLERGLRANPATPALRVALSAVYRDQGDLPRAIAELREAVHVDPASADAWNALGLLLASSGQQNEATAAFEAGLKASPDDPDLLFNLAERRLAASRPAEAARLLERLSVVSPRYPGLQAAVVRAKASAAPPPAGTVHLRLLRVRDLARAEDVARRLAAGEDFAALARTVSIDPSAQHGGDLGRVRLADLAEPLRSAAAALAPGSVSPPVTTPSGVVLLKREPS
jgi:choline-sulfatase